MVMIRPSGSVTLSPSFNMGLLIFLVGYIPKACPGFGTGILHELQRGVIVVLYREADTYQTGRLGGGH